MAVFADPQPQYDGIRAAMAERGAGGTQPQPVGFGAAILRVVDADTAPLRVFFGEMPLQLVPHLYEQRLSTWTEWADVARLAEGK